MEMIQESVCACESLAYNCVGGERRVNGRLIGSEIENKRRTLLCRMGKRMMGDLTRLGEGGEEDGWLCWNRNRKIGTGQAR